MSDNTKSADQLPCNDSCCMNPGLASPRPEFGFTEGNDAPESPNGAEGMVEAGMPTGWGVGLYVTEGNDK